MPDPNVHIPASGGSYILWLKLNRKRRISVGRLGEHLFQPGFYAYTGSAFGPGGLKARLGHHLKKSERPHWHIDYLKNIATVREIWFSDEPQNLEHLWSNALSQMPNARIPVIAFGSSDCVCPTHLLFFAEQPAFDLFQKPATETSISRLIP